MSKRSILFVITIMFIISLVGCGKSRDGIAGGERDGKDGKDGKDGIITEQLVYDSPTVSIDENTRHKSESMIESGSGDGSGSGNISDDSTVEAATIPDYSVAEITLLGNDNTTEYVILGEDIIYRGVTFDNLATIVNQIQQPYDLNTFINFIVKTVDSYGEDEIFMSLTVDEENEVNEDNGSNDEMGVGASMTLDEQLSSDIGYNEIKNKHDNTPVIWSLSLYTGNLKHNYNLYGCNKYLIYNGSEAKEIDMERLAKLSSNSEEEEETNDIDETAEEVEEETPSESIENSEESGSSENE